MESYSYQVQRFGKTTTLYAALGRLTPDINILTVEDPVEYQLPALGNAGTKQD